MYINPVLLPQVSNREDLLQTVSLFDDDTGDALDVSGRTLAAPGDFTGNSWTVTDGVIITNSVTQLTIKDYPFGNEMQAIALTVGLNLGILPGDFATIADPTGLNTMSGYVTSYAPATGALVMQVGSAFDFEIRAHHHGFGDGYGPFEDVGTTGPGPSIQAQLGSGITVVDIGVIQIRIPATTMQKLRHRTYGAAMTMFDGSDTRQVFVGKLPIISGGVMRVASSTLNAPGANGLP